MYPDWLPDELRLNRSLQEDIDELYALYKRDFIDGSVCVVDDAPVYVNSIPDRSIWEGKYPHGFTHIVTRGAKERTIDYDRAKKLPWVRAILENYTAPEVTAFWSETPKGATLYLWLADLDFVVVIRPKDGRNIVIGQKRMIITAYYIDEPYTKRDLQKKYGNSTRRL